MLEMEQYGQIGPARAAHHKRPSPNYASRDSVEQDSGDVVVAAEIPVFIVFGEEFLEDQGIDLWR